MITPQTIITVYNENKGKIYCESLSNRFGYVFDAMQDNIPFEIPMPFSDIKYINSRSAVFRDGLLRIEPDLEDEVFKFMGVAHRSENFIEIDEIKDIILSPTTEKLERILKVTSVVTMDKVRNILVELNNSDEYFIAEAVYRVVNVRYNELCAGKRKSDIIMKPKKNEKLVNDDIKEEQSSTEDITEETKKTTKKSSRK